MMKARQNASLPATVSTSTSDVESSKEPTSTISPREQLKIDFYKTYDAMTGIRIAATLGGFFGLMVILVVYKSKSKTAKALADPSRQAAAVAAAAEEERQMQAALEATVLETLNNRSGRRSLDVFEPPVSWSRNATRFSSIAGYSSLMDPPTRLSSRLPSFIDEDSPPDEDEFDDYSTCHRYLDVPRRSSNITCSSSDSSYLERRGSSAILGLPAVPAHRSCGRRRLSSPLPEIYDFYYPIDIRVIQPTPGGTPCGSERALYDTIPVAANLTESARRAPLASISSCNSSLGRDYPDLDLQSLTSDSVFQEDDGPDTEDEVEPFSTDSEGSDEARSSWKRLTRSGKKSTRSSGRKRLPCTCEAVPAIREFLASTSDSCSGTSELYKVTECSPIVKEREQTSFATNSASVVNVRRRSVSDLGGGFRSDLEGTPPKVVAEETAPDVVEKKLSYRTQKSLDSLTLVGTSEGSSTITLPTLPLAEHSPNSPLGKVGSWSQETLF